MIEGGPDGKRARVFGILNLTRDSFSDGGRFWEPERALEHARLLLHDGADVVELGPASSHPDAENVDASEEIRRLEPIVAMLEAEGVPFAVDSYRPETQLWCLEHQPLYLNDIQGFPHPEIWSALASSSCELVVMHSIQGLGRATRKAGNAETIVEEIEEFFDGRLAELVGAGIELDRIILDPGMGFFLGTHPEPSLEVLRRLPRLRTRFGLPILISVSRKSFLGAICRDAESGDVRAVEDRLPATLACELFALRQGADSIRTHDVGALKDALRVEAALGD